MKGLILCAGKGTRMRPVTYAVPKQMIPVANKPVIHYAFEAMRDIGIKELGIVVSDNRKDIEPYLGTGKEWGMKFTYVDQPKTLGIAHAVLCAEEYVCDDDFLLYLGDNLLQEGLKGISETYEKSGADSAIMLKEVPNPTAFGVAEVKGSKIINIKEKPKKPKTNLAVIGVYIFNKKVFQAAKNIKPSARGELEITDTIMELINMGGAVEPYVVQGWWKDTGRKEDMIDANRALLESISGNVAGKVDAKSTLVGEVVIEKGAKIVASTIQGPVVIGRGAVIKDSFIGPFTSISEKVTIEDAEVENSIIMAGSTVSGVSARLSSCLLGQDVEITGAQGRPKCVDMVVGDKCRIVLP